MSSPNGVAYHCSSDSSSWVGVTNLTGTQRDHTARMLRFAVEAMDMAQQVPIHPARPELGCVKMRIGVHVGPVVSSVVGNKNPRFCLFGSCQFFLPVPVSLRANIRHSLTPGDTMNVTSRMESTSEELKLQCSEEAVALARQQDESFSFTYRGEIDVKGKVSLMQIPACETCTNENFTNISPALLIYRV